MCCISTSAKEKKTFMPSQIWTYLLLRFPLMAWRFCCDAEPSATLFFTPNSAAPASNSLSVTSLLCLIRFAIFRPSDVHTANSANIFLPRPSLVWSKANQMACACCWFSCVILLSASYLFIWIELLPSLSAVRGGIVSLCSWVGPYVLCARFRFQWETQNTMEKSASCRNVTDLLEHRYNSFCFPLVF